MPAHGPRPTPPPDAETWLPGDLAESIGDGSKWVSAATGLPSFGPEKGQILYVAGVRSLDCPCGCKRPAQFLVFERFAPEAYAANWFLKITPRADEQQAGEAEWLGRFLSTPLKQPESAPCGS